MNKCPSLIRFLYSEQQIPFSVRSQPARKAGASLLPHTYHARSGNRNRSILESAATTHQGYPHNQQAHLGRTDEHLIPRTRQRRDPSLPNHTRSHRGPNPGRQSSEVPCPPAPGRQYQCFLAIYGSKLDSQSRSSRYKT